jgi:hypothetical protein
MNTENIIRKTSSCTVFFPIICMGILMIMITACGFDLGKVDTSASKTDVARSVEATLNAEKVATFQAQQTLDTSQSVAQQTESLDTEATLQAQQATLDAQATSFAPQITQPSSTEAVLTLTSVSSLEPIQILEWTMQYWYNPASGCEGVQPCWITVDDFEKHGGSDLILSSKQNYLIDPSWPNPYLTFRHKRENPNTVTVEIIIDGTPIIGQTYPKGQKYWSNDAIDLSDYKGKEIIVRFVTPGKQTKGMAGSWGSVGAGSPKTRWYVANIQIIPDYKP